VRIDQRMFLAWTMAVLFAAPINAQNPSGSAPKRSTAKASQTAEAERPLVLTEAIPLEGVKGRFDHFAQGGGRVFVAELGSNSVAVINTGGRTLDHTITGVPDPQGIAFSPEANKIFVASGRGKLYIFDGKTYDAIGTVDFPGGADNLRYDAASKHVYVGCGNDEKTGAIGVVDAMTNRKIDEYKIGGEPESFQLESKGPSIYVNIPDNKEIVVVNRDTKAVAHWPLVGVANNFPMALDEPDHRLFVGTHDPARMVVFDTTSGKQIAALPSVLDTDDLYWDGEFKRVYMPGREGFIFVFQMVDPDHYKLLAKVATALGAGTAGYYGRQGKGFDRFYLAVPARGAELAEVRIYTVQQ
jgi:YVTN family beta-propeller protein